MVMFRMGDLEFSRLWHCKTCKLPTKHLGVLTNSFKRDGRSSLRHRRNLTLLSPSAKQRQNPCSGPSPVYQDLSTRHDWSVKKAIVDLPIRMKGNSTMHFRYFVELDGGPEQGSKRCFADLIKVKLSLRRRLVRSRSKWIWKC